MAGKGYLSWKRHSLLSGTVRVWELNFHANREASHRLMGADGKHETPLGQKQRTSFLHHSMYTSLPLTPASHASQVHNCETEQPAGVLCI